MVDTPSIFFFFNKNRKKSGIQKDKNWLEDNILLKLKKKNADQLKDI